MLKLREHYPRWGRDKSRLPRCDRGDSELVVLVHEDGYQISASTVGRIIRRLKDRGVLKEPIANHISARKRPRRRPYATRKPKDYEIKQRGDMVQLDTLDVRPLPGVHLKHFTAHDVVSKWNVLSVHRQASASTAAHFLDILAARMPPMESGRFR